MRLAVAYATVGRADVLRHVIDRLATQTRRPDLVIVSAVSPTDTTGAEASPMQPELVYGPKGLCAQRNTALEHIGDRADLVLFFDDDFVPSDAYLEEAARLFTARPDVIGATGRIIADGILTPGYTLADVDAFLARDVAARDPVLTPRHSLYGCNMVIRLAALDGLRFDEHLPLYAWLEDIDLTYRLSRRGLLVTDEVMAGVHMGVKGGRTSGVRLGYSQIANPVYMLRRGTIPKALAYERIFRNLAANLVKSARPEPYVDRLGRLRGNLIAIRDFATGRIDPERILSM